MLTRTNAVTICALVSVVAWTQSCSAQEPSKAAEVDSAPIFTAAGELVRPADYREWVFVTSGLGMTYGPAKPADNDIKYFDNVFVTRQAYREFMRTGSWPENTIIVLEGRKSTANVSIDKGGLTQGEVAFLEAAVKDRQRFPDTTWAYFDFGGPTSARPVAKSLPASADCYGCHSTHAAVDNTFVQFYPTLFEVAKRLGTVKATYDPTR